MPKARLNELFRKMNNTRLKLPDYIYNNIRKSITKARIQNKKKIMSVKFSFPILKYAAMLILIAGITYIYFKGRMIPVSLEKLKGTASYSLKDSQWQEYRKHSQLKQGGLLQTGNNSIMQLKIEGIAYITLQENSIVKITKTRRFLWAGKYIFEVIKGNHIYEVINNDKCLISTGHAIIKALGTKLQVIETKKNTKIKVINGRIAVKRIIKNKKYLGKLKYEKSGYQGVLKSVLNTEAIIKTNEIAIVDNMRNAKITGLINNLKDQIVDFNSILNIERNILIHRIKPGQNIVRECF